MAACCTQAEPFQVLTVKSSGTPSADEPKAIPVNRAAPARYASGNRGRAAPRSTAVT